MSTKMKRRRRHDRRKLILTYRAEEFYEAHAYCDESR